MADGFRISGEIQRVCVCVFDGDTENKLSHKQRAFVATRMNGICVFFVCSCVCVCVINCLLPNYIPGKILRSYIYRSRREVRNLPVCSVYTKVLQYLDIV